MTKWISSKEISSICEGCNLDKAREILKVANKRVTDSGCMVPNQKKAPRKIVLELLGMNE